MSRDLILVDASTFDVKRFGIGDTHDTTILSAENLYIVKLTPPAKWGGMASIVKTLLYTNKVELDAGGASLLKAWWDGSRWIEETVKDTYVEEASEGEYVFRLPVGRGGRDILINYTMTPSKRLMHTLEIGIMVSDGNVVAVSQSIRAVFGPN